MFLFKVIYQQQNPGIKYNYQLPMKRQESDVYLLKDDPVIAPPFLRHTSGDIDSSSLISCLTYTKVECIILC